MTSIFDGMAGVLNSVFGAPVWYLPQSGGGWHVHSVFREEPVEVNDAEGAAILILAPTWKVPANLATAIARGDMIEPGNGKRYTVVNRLPGGSPAVDAYVMFELERET